MENIMKFYFKLQRENQNITIEHISAKSFIDYYVIYRYENTKEELEEYQLIRLFNVLNINYRKIKREFIILADEINAVYKKIFFYIQDYKNDFETLKKRVYSVAGSPINYSFKVLQMLVSNEDNELFQKLYSEVEEYFDYLSVFEKKVYFLAIASNKEFNKDLNEALDIYLQAYNLDNVIDLSDLLEERIAIIYLKQMNIGKALEFCLLAKKHYQVHGNRNRLIIIQIYEALVYTQLMNYDEAIAVYEAALKMTESMSLGFMDNTIINNLILVYLYKKDFHKIIHYCQKLIKNRSKRNDVYFYKLWAYYHLKEYEAAQIVIEQADIKIKDDIKNAALVKMTKELIENKKPIATIYIEGLEAMKKLNNYEMIYFILDILIEYYYATEQYKECCDYVFMKKNYQKMNLQN